jgi:hypothetical protein
MRPPLGAARDCSRPVAGLTTALTVLGRVFGVSSGSLKSNGSQSLLGPLRGRQHRAFPAWPDRW